MRSKNKKEEEEETATEENGVEAVELSEVEKLKVELEAKTLEAKENYDLYIRGRAEMDNLRKRLEKEKLDHAKYGNERLIKELLDVVDNFERALEHVDDENNHESLKGGLKLVYDQTNLVLERFGLVHLPAVGEKFDPTRHEAISHEESTDAEPGTVLTEFKKGYLLKDRLIRPSMVSVAKEATKADADEAPSD